ncbi:uncharacterized protein LKV04_007514 [Tautogolabrus adspersus]
MFVLICSTLLLSVRDSSAQTGTSLERRPFCQGDFCITLIDGEITAEAGLCVVIPCSFTTSRSFRPQGFVWFKCEKKCSASNMILNSDSTKVQPGFKGRVSMLQPDVSRRNCSIIINDLTASDSGSYQLRVMGFQLFGKPEDGFTFSSKATVSVKELIQKPTVMVPPLTEGWKTTLSCTAPGLCSGSAPEITWMWRGGGENDSHITGSIIDFAIESLNAVSQRHSSTLTLNPSFTQHHNTEVTCRVTFVNNITTEETVTLKVNLYPKILNSSICEVQSDVLTCVCASEGLPLPTIKWPLLENHTQYSVTTTVTSNTVTSTLLLTVKDQSNTVVECVSSSEVGDVKQSLTIITSERREDQHSLIPWVVAAVSLSVNVVLIISLMFLCNKRKTVKPNQEDRTYMSLKKRDQSAEYDVIVVIMGCDVSCGLPVCSVPARLLRLHIKICSVEGVTDSLNNQIRMFVLMWTTLLFCVWGSNADVGASLERTEFCQGDFCITLIDGEITAEAGLCVVIPCSFTISSSFYPQSLVWFKCEPNQRCDDSDVIFSKNSQQIQPGFKGRVSLLEPNVFQRNCSIIINDLTASDSGSYQLRVNLVRSGGRTDKFQYLQRATVFVKDLTQKPTLTVPPLTEGLQTTLSCTAPGLCSGSAPEITWMWRGGGGENDSHITGNITDFKTVAQSHSSNLSFTPSAKHHGTNITCKVGFTGGTTAEKTVTLNVTYVKEVKISGNTSVREGELLQLTCSVESFPPSLVTWTKMFAKDIQSGSKPDVQNDTSANPENTTETYLQGGNGQVTFSITNVTAKDSGQYICTVNHSNITLVEKVDIEVIYMKTPVITGNTNIAKRETLNLTCSVESFPPSRITWTLPGSNTYLQNDTGSATLVIPNVRVDNSGRYICTAKHLDTTVTVFTDVTLLPSIFENSGCEFQSGLLTCVCISEGFPLPTIRWPLLRNRTEYSVMTSVTNHTVNSTITLHVDDCSNMLAECVSRNENGETKKKFNIKMTMLEKEDGSRVLKMFSRLEVIIAFLIGALLSAVFCFLANKCHRKRQNSSGNLDKTLEMVTSQEDPLIDAGQEVEDVQTYDQEVTEAGGAVAGEKAALDLTGESNDVEYASIDFSLLKRKSAKKQETTETEYAEIKKEVKEQREDKSEEVGEVMEDNEEDMIIGEDETKNCVPEEEEGQDEAVYSNVKDVMDEI